MKQKAFVAAIIGLVVASETASLRAETRVSLSTESTSPRITLNSKECDVRGASSTTRQDIINAAAVEWSKFGFPRYAITPEKGFDVMPPGISPKITDTRGDGTAPRLLSIGWKEDDPEVRTAIGRYWAATPSANSIFSQQNDLWASYKDAGWAVPWSAAFVSHIMCQAGLSADEFARNESHKAYITAAVNAAPGYRFRAQNLDQGPPIPGDLICTARGRGSENINSIIDFQNAPGHSIFHCDIVVGFDAQPPQPPGTVYAIGGNVLDAVTLTEAPMRSNRLLPVKAPHGRNWFTVLRYVGPEGPASFRDAPSSVLSAATKVRDARREIAKSTK